MAGPCPPFVEMRTTSTRRESKMAEQHLLEERRENWGTRTGFVLAAIGSAVGLGNLWGFPYQVYSHGGGAFLIPYVIAMLLVGIPLLILEFSLGHMTQKAAPDAYRGISRRTEMIGWWGIILGFVIVTFYPVILAYCGSYLIECIKGIVSYKGELAWKGMGLEGINDHFFKDYLQMWPEDAGVKPWALGKLITPIVASLAVIWVLMYFCIFRGVKMVSKVVLLTVPLPWIMLCVLTVRGLTLPGSASGLNFYLDPDWSELAKPDTWRAAFGQMFFSMSLAFGVMITYASFLHRKSDINNNAAIIGLADMGTSFIAGIAVFATLGAMSYATAQAGQPVPVQEVAKEGPSLAFVAFPYALAQLPYSAWFGAVFFIALLTLGIDSAFSITESVLASLVDKTGWSRGKTLIVMTLVGFALGLVYCTRGGLVWLGSIADDCIFNWSGISLLGLLECVVIGWAYRLGRLREHANERSDWHLSALWDFVIRYVAPFILSALAVWTVLDQASQPGGLLYSGDGTFKVPTLVSLLLAAAAPVLAVILSRVKSPGADAHAEHVGQPRTGRKIGLVGTAVVVVGLVAAVWCFVLAMQANWQSQQGKPISEIMPIYSLWGYEVSRACALAVVAAATGLVGVVLGSCVVGYAERNARRPSGFARFSAACGVMLMGVAAGLSLALFVMGREFPESPSQPARDAGTLTGPSAMVLGCMIGLLVIGLGWCFFRALTAAGTAQAVQEQVSEGAQAE